MYDPERINFAAIEAENELRKCEQDAIELEARIRFWQKKLAEATGEEIPEPQDLVAVSPLNSDLLKY